MAAVAAGGDNARGSAAAAGEGEAAVVQAEHETAVAAAEAEAAEAADEARIGCGRQSSGCKLLEAAPSTRKSGEPSTNAR